MAKDGLQEPVTSPEDSNELIEQRYANVGELVETGIDSFEIQGWLISMYCCSSMSAIAEGRFPGNSAPRKVHSRE